MPADALAIGLGKAQLAEAPVFVARRPHGEVRAELHALRPVDLAELARAARAQVVHRARHVQKAVLVLEVLEGQVGHAPAAEVGGAEAQAGEGVQDPDDPARMRVVVAVVPAVHEDGQAPLFAEAVEPHEAGVVHVDGLGVRMDLDAAQAERQGAVELALHVLEVLVHGGEPYEAAVVGAGAADETAGKVEVTATAEKVEAVEATFTVESFSTFVLTWKNASDQEEKATIHYGTYTDGSFVEFAEETIVLDTGATNVSIANTFEGYTYLSAVYCEPGQTIAEGVDMGEVLFKNGNTWEADTYVSDETTHTTDTVRKTIVNGANIYAIYFKPEKPNPQGGGDENIPSPETTKTVKVNDDGTATITLDIVGKTVQSDESHYANVLIILDATVSMDGAKWTNAKAAMKALIETLSEGDNAGNAGKIDYALVTFGRSATVVQNWTKDNATFKTTCANISMVTTSGTNWEAGMRGGLYGVLNNMPDNDPTYVIFLTDGDPNTWYWTTEDIGSSIPNTWPTQRVSQDNIGDEDFYGASDTYMRPGYQGNSSTAADRSKDEAKKIATGRYLYGIYCGDSGTTPSGTSFNRLVDVITGEGQGGQKAISANADTIESEFKAIAETILNNLGANNVTVDDGVPELSSVSTSVSGAADGFKYYIKEKGAADFSEWTDHPGTAYSEYRREPCPPARSMAIQLFFILPRFFLLI